LIGQSQLPLGIALASFAQVVRRDGGIGHRPILKAAKPHLMTPLAGS
jgi:hypothetical protein